MKIRIDPLDTIFAEYIKAKAAGACEYCGRTDRRLECSHFHGRRKRVTRWDEENCAALCHGCHSYLGEHPNMHTAWFEKRLGSEKFEKLNIRAEMIEKNTDKVKLMEYFKEKLRAIKE